MNSFIKLVSAPTGRASDRLPHPPKTNQNLLEHAQRFLPHEMSRTYQPQKCIACLVILTAGFSLAGVTESPLPVAGSVSQKIDKILDAQVAQGVVPGIAVAIAKDAQVVYLRGAGVRDVSTRAPMLATTPQRIGSVTKQFTAAAILMLQQDKKLSTDDYLSKYVPEYVYSNRITLRQMLNMVSGISNDDLAIYEHLTEPISWQRMIANLNKLPLMWEPGTHMVYTNTNYNLLGTVVERVSGQSYLTFLRDRIFTPLGMSSAGTMDQPPPGLATGYYHENPGQPFEVRPELSSDFAFATGNLAMTPLDLLKWDAGLLSKRLLDDASLRTMFTVPGDGQTTTVKETDERFPVVKGVDDGGPTIYAMGWMIPDPDTRWHGGQTFLFKSANALFSDGYTIAIIGNVRDAGAFDPGNLATEIHNLLNPDLTLPPVNIVIRPAVVPFDTKEAE